MKCPKCADIGTILVNAITNHWEDCEECAVERKSASCPECKGVGKVYVNCGPSDYVMDPCPKCQATCPNCFGRAKISPEHNLSTFNVEDSVDEAWELTHERKYS